MDASSREAKAKWRAQQRVLARSGFPLPDAHLQQLFDHVRAQLERAVTYADPALAGDDWDLKEDLLQLQHSARNRLADLGWYECPPLVAERFQHTAAVVARQLSIYMQPLLNGGSLSVREMYYFVSNGLGDSKEMPSEAELRDFLDGVDPTDVEHGAAWVGDELDNGLEFNGDGTLVFSRGSGAPPRHLAGVSKPQALALWLLLLAGRLDEIERQPWMPGLRAPLPPEEAARRQRERADWQLQDDRKFYDLLGAEHARDSCRKDGCTRGRISHSALCRVHHFESIRGRPCPFDGS